MEHRIVIDTPVSGVIAHDPVTCTGCGVCALMCSLYQEGVQGLAQSRLQLDRDPFSAAFSINVCRQCRYPACYYACPLRGEALDIDRKTGARYVNEEVCTGCGLCREACPLEPPRVTLHTEKPLAFKCDLCRDRAEGPICVEYCPVGALQLIPGEKR